jgi:hypothetical protein
MFIILHHIMAVLFIYYCLLAQLIVIFVGRGYRILGMSVNTKFYIDGVGGRIDIELSNRL